MKARFVWAVSQLQISNRCSPQVPQEQANRAATRVTAASAAEGVEAHAGGVDGAEAVGMTVL